MRSMIPMQSIFSEEGDWNLINKSVDAAQEEREPNLLSHVVGSALLAGEKSSNNLILSL